MTKLHDVHAAHDRYWRDGLTLREVASEYGMDHGALCWRFVRAGLPRRPVGRKAPRRPGVEVHPVEAEDEQKHERDARYLAALDRLGTATVADLAREVEAAPKQVLYHVNRFVARGAIDHVGGRGGIGDPRRYAVRRGQ